jgi:hypothetical protein
MERFIFGVIYMDRKSSARTEFCEVNAVLPGVSGRAARVSPGAIYWMVE